MFDSAKHAYTPIRLFHKPLSPAVLDDVVGGIKQDLLPWLQHWLGVLLLPSFIKEHDRSPLLITPVPPFCIIGTPRSRTAWFARFLSHGAVRCAHEPSRYWRDAGDIADYFRPDVGAADSMLTLKARELAAAGVNLVVVTRPLDDVLASFRRAGIPTPPPIADQVARLNEHIAALPAGLPRFEFAKLDLACGDIFKLCIGYPCPVGWRGIWRHRRVEADFRQTLQAARANAAGLATFYNMKVI
jgi:hypothetical protein